MPYRIERHGSRYRVVNMLTGRVLAYSTTLRKARAQVRLLNEKERST